MVRSRVDVCPTHRGSGRRFEPEWACIELRKRRDGLTIERSEDAPSVVGVPKVGVVCEHINKENRLGAEL